MWFFIIYEYISSWTLYKTRLTSRDSVHILNIIWDECTSQRRMSGPYVGHHFVPPKNMLFICSLRKPERKPKVQSRMDNPEKQATLRTQDTRGRKTNPKSQCNICWIPLCVNRHK